MRTRSGKATNEPEPPKNEDDIESDEEDEDYVPDADVEGADNDDGNSVADYDTHGGTSSSGLSITKQKAVDDAFNELFGLDFTAINTSATSDRKSRSKIPARRSRMAKKQRRILSSIFGAKSADKLFLSSKSVASRARPKPASNGTFRLERRTVVEVKRFAGREIKVEKVVMVPVMEERNEKVQKREFSSSAAATTPIATDRRRIRTRQSKSEVQPKGLDSLLNEMSRPEKLSTVAKTSADWNLFKEKSDNAQLKDELEKKAMGNEAYLVKKDFLNRVDVRRFELEKAERERERVKRAASNK
ncbi:hypothetical protein ACHAXS_006401 [Conticribra weissflogii]